MLGSRLSLLRGRLNGVEELVRIGRLKDDGLDERTMLPFCQNQTRNPEKPPVGGGSQTTRPPQLTPLQHFG